MNGKYELRRKIGQGSFGSVFLALERRTRKAVVVKQVWRVFQISPMFTYPRTPEIIY